jgi:hypothetical protein
LLREQAKKRKQEKQQKIWDEVSEGESVIDHDEEKKSEKF